MSHRNVMENLNGDTPEEYYTEWKPAHTGVPELSGELFSMPADKPIGVDARNLPRLTWDHMLQLMRNEYQITENFDHNIIVMKQPYFPLHEHIQTYFETVYVLSGTYTYQINQDMELLQTGDLCILPPYARHSAQMIEEGAAVNILIQPASFTDIFSGILCGQDLLGDFLMNSIYRNNSENYLLFHTGQDEITRSVILEMCHEMMNADEYSDRIISGMLVTLFTKLVRTHKDILKSAPENKRDYEILSMIYDNYATISLSQLAEHLHYTVPHCSKYIRKHLGCNFSDLIKRIRFQKAESLLVNSRMTVTQISKHLGYENLENFVRAFKQIYEMTPSQYRALHSPISPPPVGKSGLPINKSDNLSLPVS